MNWTDPSPPKEGTSYYDHVICKSPLGIFLIEWKSWKESDSYAIMLDDAIYLGSETSLDEAKEVVKKYLADKINELSIFLED